MRGIVRAVFLASVAAGCGRIGYEPLWAPPDAGGMAGVTGTAGTGNPGTGGRGGRAASWVWAARAAVVA